MPPFFQCQLDSEEFPVADVIVLLCRAELAGKEGTWMKFGWSPLLLRLYDPYSGGGGINFNNEGFFRVRVNEDRCIGESTP